MDRRLLESTHRSSSNHANAMDGTKDDIFWNDEATRQEDLEVQEDDLLFNDEDIMSTEQLKQLFMESDGEDFLGFE